MLVRLQKQIANNGYCSRRQAEILIVNRKVKVNNLIIDKLGYKVSENDIITINGKIISKVNKKIYILFNKPRYVVTTLKDPQNRTIILDYFKDIQEKIYPIGRLDYDTSGIILLTNDGDFAQKVSHPSNNINKTYLVIIKGRLSQENIYDLENGIQITEDFITSNAEVNNLRYRNNKTYIHLTIHEGKNHQIKKMFSCLGYPVLKLKRIKISNISIGNLKSGEYRFLTSNEVSNIMKK